MTSTEIYFLSLFAIIAGSIGVGFLLGSKYGRAVGYREAVDEWFEDFEPTGSILDADAIGEEGSR